MSGSASDGLESRVNDMSTVKNTPGKGNSDRKSTDYKNMAEMRKDLMKMKATLDKFEDRERDLKEEIASLESKSAWQSLTLKENDEVIHTLTSIIQLLTGYITELEQGSGGPSFEYQQDTTDYADSITGYDVTKIFSRTNDRGPFNLRPWLENAEEQISKLRNGIEALTSRRFSVQSSTSMSTNQATSVPYSFSETEFSINNDVRLRERLSAFSKEKCYQVHQSNVSVQLPMNFFSQDVGISGERNQVVIGNKTMMVTLSLRRKTNGERAISLIVRGWKSCSCLKSCCEDVEFVSRCLILASLSCQRYESKKRYIATAVRLTCGNSAETSQVLSGTVLVQDPELWSSSRHSGFDNFDSKSATIFSVTILRLVYESRPGSLSELIPPAEKLQLYRQRLHMNCVDVVFRFSNHRSDVIKACDCSLKRLSPQIRSDCESAESSLVEYKLEDISLETMSAFLSYAHGINNGVAWRENILLNLEMLDFAHEFFMAELAQLSTDNLITNPDGNYSLELVLKLQAAARKYRNPDLAAKAQHWLLKELDVSKISLDNRDCNGSIASASVV